MTGIWLWAMRGFEWIKEDQGPVVEAGPSCLDMLPPRTSAGGGTSRRGTTRAASHPRRTRG